jgi:hypothetical protein
MVDDITWNMTLLSYHLTKVQHRPVADNRDDGRYSLVAKTNLCDQKMKRAAPEINNCYTGIRSIIYDAFGQ